MTIKQLLVSSAAVLCLGLASPTVALAQTTDGAAGVVGGTITHGDSKKILVRGEDDEWTIYLDPASTMMMGHPSVDSPALIWFKKGSDGNMWASRVYVPQTEMWPTGNILAPGSGQVAGQVKSLTANSIVIRQGGADWTFAFDGKNSVTEGKPAIDGNATVWYGKADNGTMYAKKIKAMK